MGWLAIFRLIAVVGDCCTGALAHLSRVFGWDRVPIASKVGAKARVETRRST